MYIQQCLVSIRLYKGLEKKKIVHKENKFQLFFSKIGKQPCAAADIKLDAR
jgi:hypothetical protein